MGFDVYGRERGEANSRKIEILISAIRELIALPSEDLMNSG
jgi:hypothetical protein